MRSDITGSEEYKKYRMVSTNMQILNHIKNNHENNKLYCNCNIRHSSR